MQIGIRRPDLKIHVIAFFQEFETAREVYGKLINSQVILFKEEGERAGVYFGNKIRVDLFIDEVGQVVVVKVHRCYFHMGMKIKYGLAQVAAAPVIDVSCIDKNRQGSVVIYQLAVLNDDLFN